MIIGTMAGHSKWAKVKHRKAVTDAKKSQIFSKLSRLISTVSKLTGGDLSSHSLKTVVEKARAANMPAENIERAIKRGAGEEGESYESVTYEAYGPGGAALIIEALTDNRNRTASEIRHILNESGASLANPGSAAWAFKKDSQGWEPQAEVNLSEADTEKLSALIEKLEDHPDVQEVYTNEG